MLSALFWKNKRKTVDDVTRILGRFVGLARREISKGYSESILIKFWDIIVYIMNIIWWGLKKKFV